MFLYAFSWLQAFLYWFLMPSFGLVSHAIMWVVIFLDILVYNLRDVLFILFGAVCAFVIWLTKGRFRSD
jgi:hypothetical protein